MAKFLPQNISKIVSKDINRKHENNQNIIERKVITTKKKKKKINMRMFPLDTESRFAIIKKRDAIKKTK